MKKALSIAVLFLLIIGMAPNVFANGLEDKNFLKRTYLGSPIPSYQVLHAVFAESNGDDYMYTSTSGSPAIFNVYNLDKHKLEESYELTGAKNIWYHLMTDDGVIYIASKNKLFSYDINGHLFRKLESIPTNENDLFVFDCDKDGNIYFGMCTYGHVIKYDTKKEEYEDLGAVTSGITYVRSLTYLNGWIYCGVKGDGKVELWRIKADNPSEKERLYLPENPDYYDLDKIEWIYDSNAAGDYVIFYCKEVAVSPMIVYDTISEKFVDIGFNGSFKGLYSSPVRNGKTYFQSKGRLYSLNTATGKVENENMEVSTSDTFHAVGWVTVENDEELPGESIICINTTTGQPVFYNLTTKVRKTWNDVVLKGGAFSIQSMAPGDYKNNDHAIYIGAYLSDAFARYDYEEKRSDYHKDIAQIEDMISYNGKMYFGTYTRANIYEYDNSMEYASGSNPKIIGKVGTLQDRPWSSTILDGKVWFGTVPEYGVLGGDLAEYNPETGEFKTYEQPVENQSIIGLAAKDGLIYGSTSVWGGLSSTPKAAEAKIFVFDPTTGKTVKSYTPELNGITSPKWIGELIFDKEGILWGVSGTTVFAIDTESDKVIKQKKFGDYTFSETTHTWRPIYLYFDNDGYLYANLDGISIIDTKTMESRSLLHEVGGSKVHIYALDEYGNIYFAQSDELWKLPVSESNYTYPDVQNVKERFKGNTLLKIKNPVMYAGNKFIYCDNESERVFPVIKNNTALVPVRVIAESLGISIKWDEEERQVRFSGGDISLSLKIGDSVMKSNNGEISLSYPAEIINNRTYIPLRAVGEAFRKNVLWNESGLIIISDKKESYSEDEIKLIDILFDNYAYSEITMQNKTETAAEEYDEILKSIGGRQLEFKNWNFENEIKKNGDIDGFVKTQPFGEGCSAEISYENPFKGDKSLKITDISMTNETGYSSSYIPVSGKNRYRLILPLYMLSGRTSVAINYYNADKEYIGSAVHNEEPPMQCWTILNYEIEMKYKAAKYIRMKLYTSEYWISECFYDEVTVIEY